MFGFGMFGFLWVYIGSQVIRYVRLNSLKVWFDVVCFVAWWTSFKGAFFEE